MLSCPRLNRLWEEVENRYVQRVTIAPQTFCGLVEIKLDHEDTAHQYITNTPSKFANYKQLLATPTRQTARVDELEIGKHVDGLIVFERPFWW